MGRVATVIATVAGACLVFAPMATASTEYVPPAPIGPPPQAPLAGRYVSSESGVELDIGFERDGAVALRTVAGGDCPRAGAVVAEGGWTGDRYLVHTYFWELRADPPNDEIACRPGVHYEVAVIYIDGPSTVRVCSEDSPGSATFSRCTTFTRLTSQFIVEFVAWIPHSAIVDPALPSPTAGLPADHAALAPAAIAPCLAADLVESTIGGQGHRELVEPLLAVVRATFQLTADGAVADVQSEALPMSIGRLVAGFSESGEAAECAQAVTLTGDQVGSVVVSGNTVSMKIDTDLGVVPTGPDAVDSTEAAILGELGCGDVGVPCELANVIPTLPRLRGAVDVVVKEDGTVTVQGSVQSFPSFGVHVSVQGTAMASVLLNDSSCFRLDGEGGLTNLFELARRVRSVAIAPVTVLADHVCVPVALPGDTIDPLDLIGGDATQQALFVLATRYAEGR